ncbi:hypothetical protein [Hymenobacter negativus]|uniref:Uncharacterized protein n=1 Tax=Hymenobacter negativus TaxID=2795026 RepID=A0ABS3QK77_9BACT|nr:hypothetical protein [Hymenobacter negativus]MBO2011656.1 hypothetical protein [Hymenobacter negativus]
MLLATILYGFGRRQAKALKERKQQLAQDEMTLPSQSQRLMQLADTLSRVQRDTLFRHHNLSDLFQTYGQNGFFGPHEQRLEVVFTQVSQDGVVPGTYHLAGLMRVAGVISSLSGTIELRQVRNFFESADGIYIATGLFHFQQHTSSTKQLAHLDGLVAIDFAVKHDKSSLFAVEGAIRSRSRHFAFEGKWTDARTSKRQRVLWADEFAPVANAVLGDFDIGGRMATVNPKYRKYGWTEYFQNDEWWGKPLKPRLSL